MSGVYYAAVPPGSAPLVLRKPKTDNGQLDESQQNIFEEILDEVHAPTEGDLVLFPPWVEHGVPAVAEAQENIESSSNLARVSFAFNVTGAFALGNDPWNVTRLK